MQPSEPSESEITVLAHQYPHTQDFARALLARYGKNSTNSLAASAEPVELVEAVTKAIMFEDCGNTTDWRDNTDLGKAAIRAYAAAVRAAIAPHRAEQVALMQEADKDGRVFNGQGHAQAIQAIDFCLASLAAPVAAQAQPSANAHKEN